MNKTNASIVTAIMYGCNFAELFGCCFVLQKFFIWDAIHWLHFFVYNLLVQISIKENTKFFYNFVDTSSNQRISKIPTSTCKPMCHIGEAPMTTIITEFPLEDLIEFGLQETVWLFNRWKHSSFIQNLPSPDRFVLALNTSEFWLLLLLRLRLRMGELLRSL